MVRVRKLVLVIAAASALSSGMAHALGLGEVTLKSSLNQPLVAEIELLEVRDLASTEVTSRLASPEEFVKAGVDRQYFLTGLKFTPVLKPNGKSVVRITSSKTVREPYLNFLVEVTWPNGRLLREYTLLLDPPLYSTQTTVAAAPQLPIAVPTPRQHATSGSVSRAISGNEYKTMANDTLWEIARRVGGGAVNQTMLAIQDLNPNAFIGGNINRMKSGQVLRLPDEQQIRRRSNAEAVAQVAEQNAAWRGGRAVASRQLDATRRASAGATPATVKSGDSLKLVAANSGHSTRGSDTGSANGKALADKLAVTQESLDSTRRENSELQSRINDLQSQLDKLQRLIELKDNQLAKLQADMAAVPETSTAPVTPEEPAAPAAEAAPPDHNDSEEPTAPAEDSSASTEQPANAPAAVIRQAESAPESQSFIDDLLGNPMILGVAAGGVLLLIGLLVLSRRNAMKVADLQEESAYEHEMAQQKTFASNLDVSESFVDLIDEVPQAASAAATEERVSAQTGDALGEADIYIAYSRFNQAAELLLNAINDDPHRSDLRLKLMEVYAELGNREGFARQSSELRKIGGTNAEVEQLKAKYPMMVAVADAGSVVAATAVADDLENFSIDDLTLDEPIKDTRISDGDLESDFNHDLTQDASTTLALDDDFDSDLVDEPAVSADASSDDLSFDLALDDDDIELSPDSDFSDFSLDLDASVAQPADELTDLSLDLPAEVPAVDFDLPSAVDLPLDDEEPTQPIADSESATVQSDEVTAELDQSSDDLGQPEVAPQSLDSLSEDSDGDDDFDFLSGTDETATKLDLARAYIDMGDTEGARDILDEVIAEGSDVQQQEAREMVSKLV